MNSVVLDLIMAFIIGWIVILLAFALVWLHCKIEDIIGKENLTTIKGLSVMALFLGFLILTIIKL